MTRTVHCAKLGKTAEGLDFPPFPGEMGQRIYNEISKEAWQMWLAHQTMLINENRLSAMDPKSREYLKQAMQDFLFGEGPVHMPEGYTPPKK
ncbi:MAG: oxidative damage protection protein [Gammaproteobacteria bacterium]|nr:MAG: oxidative damage protection protein [Gammaproteobacteria bacterium]